MPALVILHTPSGLVAAVAAAAATSLIAGYTIHMLTYQQQWVAGAQHSSCRRVQSLCSRKRQQRDGEAGQRTCSFTQAWDTLEVCCRVISRIHDSWQFADAFG
jgi:hypothetical protein